MTVALEQMRQFIQRQHVGRINVNASSQEIFRQGTTVPVTVLVL